MTILNQRFQTPYGTAPFSKINTSDFPAAFTTAIEKAKANIDTICKNNTPPTFENTIETLEFSGLELFQHREDDGPAYLTMLLVGYILVPLLLTYEYFNPNPQFIALFFQWYFHHWHYICCPC